MKEESLIVGATLAFFTAVLVGSVMGQAPEEIAYSTAKSVILSPTPLEAITSATAYIYGFSCHYATTSEAYKAFRNNDPAGIFSAADKNQYCFSDAAKMTGVGK